MIVMLQQTCGVVPMDLPNLFTQAKHVGYSKRILSVILTDTAVQALLLEVSSEQSRILTQSSLERYGDSQTCIIKVDEVLQQLGPESESVSEVLFCVPHSWTEGANIISERKPQLQKIITDLSLKPLGFLVQTEVLSDYLIAGNKHISTVIILVDENHVSLIILGKGLVQSVQTVGRSGDVSADIQEALARFLQQAGETFLPAKVICASFMLNEDQLHEIQQTLLGSGWEAHLPFVQKPTVDSIPPSFFLKVIAQQAGKAVFSSVSHKTDSERETIAQNFGVPIPVSAAGFAELSPADADPAVQTEELPVLRNKYTSQGGVGFARLFGFLHSHSGSSAPVSRSVTIGFAAGLCALITAVILWVTLLAPVIITVAPQEKTLAKDIALILDPQATEADLKTLRIPGKKVSVELKKTSSTRTTGIKIVGDPAKGEVIVFNKTPEEKKFPAGTQLAAGEQKYTLDAELTVPAAVEKDSGKDYGQAKAAVTAATIGDEGNIAAETKLAVASFDVSSYAATAVTAFAGGTSREVKVVAQADKDLLLSDLKKDVLAEANKSFTAESGAGVYIIPAKDVLFTKTVFSHEKEALTDELAVEIEATVTTLSYTSDALVPVARAVLADQLPVGFTLTDDPPQILSVPKTAGSEKTAATTITITANLTATARAQVDTTRIKEAAAGKPIAQLPDLLRAERVAGVQVDFIPVFLSRFINTVPSQQSRITVRQGQAQ